jgi:hypothetical protein
MSDAITQSLAGAHFRASSKREFVPSILSIQNQHLNYSLAFGCIGNSNADCSARLCHDTLDNGRNGDSTVSGRRSRDFIAPVLIWWAEEYPHWSALAGRSFLAIPISSFVAPFRILCNHRLVTARGSRKINPPLHEHRTEITQQNVR